MAKIKEKLKKLFTNKGKEQSEPLTKEQQEMIIKGAGNMVESSNLDVAPALKKLKEKLKGGEPLMSPSIQEKRR